MAYLMYAYNLSVEEAKEMVRRKREGADPNIGFVQVLKEVEGRLRRKELE